MTNMKIFVFFAALVLILHCVTGQPTRSDSGGSSPKPCFEWNSIRWIGNAPSAPVATECGLVECVVCSGNMKSILVATGCDDDYNNFNDAQVVTPNESNTCSLPPVPKAFHSGTGGVVDNSIILCGGYNGVESLSTCHIFDNESKSWKTTNMVSRRHDPASAPLNGALWVSGGYDGNGGDRLSTSELIHPDGTIRPGPSLPSEMAYHSVVTLKEDESYMVINDDGNVYIYNASSEKFSKMPSTGRKFVGGRATCASFKSAAHGNRPVVVCVGDYWKAKIFDYTKASEWERIPGLPTDVGFEATAITSVDGSGVYVQHGEKFYELNCSNRCKWTVMSQTLPKAVRIGIMMYIPPELTCFS